MAVRVSSQAQQQSQKALTLARELPHPYNLVYALNLASRVCWLRGKQGPSDRCKRN